MPVIFLRSIPSDAVRFEPLREVVDGQQRIRTLVSFIAPDLLPDFNPQRDSFTVRRNHNRELAGKSFSQLSPEIQQRLIDYEFSVHVFPSDIDDREILQIFARMNATGVKLNAQELRNAEFFGEFKSLMYELAAEQLPRWRKWGVFSEGNIARMEEVELTSEFALLMLGGIGKREQSAISAAYRRYEDEFPQAAEVARRYHAVMDAIDDQFDVRVTQFSKKTLFYSLFAAVYALQFGLDDAASRLDRRSAATITREQIAWLRTAAERIEQRTAPSQVIEATERRTTDAGSRQRLVKYLTQSQ